MRRNKKALAKFLFCLGVLEGRTFQLFGRISEKVELPRVKFSLLYLAYDSLKNSVILGELSKSFAVSEVKAGDYERVLGSVWNTVERLSKDVLKKERITEKNLLSLADRLIGIYTVTLVELKTLRFMSKEISEAYSVDLEVLEGILELLIGDEEIDSQVLMTLKDLFAEKPKAAVEGAPTVKYSNPDLWYAPVSSSD